MALSLVTRVYHDQVVVTVLVIWVRWLEGKSVSVLPIPWESTVGSMGADLEKGEPGQGKFVCLCFHWRWQMALCGVKAGVCQGALHTAAWPFLSSSNLHAPLMFTWAILHMPCAPLIPASFNPQFKCCFYTDSFMVPQFRTGLPVPIFMTSHFWNT